MRSLEQNARKAIPRAPHAHRQVFKATGSRTEHTQIVSEGYQSDTRNDNPNMEVLPTVLCAGAFLLLIILLFCKFLQHVTATSALRYPSTNLKRPAGEEAQTASVQCLEQNSTWNEPQDTTPKSYWPTNEWDWTDEDTEAWNQGSWTDQGNELGKPGRESGQGSTGTTGKTRVQLGEDSTVSEKSANKSARLQDIGDYSVGTQRAGANVPLGGEDRQADSGTGRRQHPNTGRGRKLPHAHSGEELHQRDTADHIRERPGLSDATGSARQRVHSATDLHEFGPQRAPPLPAISQGCRVSRKDDDQNRDKRRSHLSPWAKGDKARPTHYSRARSDHSQTRDRSQNSDWRHRTEGRRSCEEPSPDDRRRGRSDIRRSDKRGERVSSFRQREGSRDQSSEVRDRFRQGRSHNRQQQRRRSPSVEDKREEKKVSWKEDPTRSSQRQERLRWAYGRKYAEDSASIIVCVDYCERDFEDNNVDIELIPVHELAKLIKTNEPADRIPFNKRHFNWSPTINGWLGEIKEEESDKEAAKSYRRRAGKRRGGRSDFATTQRRERAQRYREERLRHPPRAAGSSPEREVNTHFVKKIRIQDD